MLLMPKARDSDVDAEEEAATNDRDESTESSVSSAAPAAESGGLITKLNKNDVLMGRGAPSAEYEGNSRLRGIVLGRREDYVNAPKRRDKHRIAVEIIETVHKNKGRFLRRVEDEDTLQANGLETNDSAWELVQDKSELLSKVKQLLRDIGPVAKEKRAARRQERKRLRDVWPPPTEGREEGKGLSSSEEGTSKGQTSLASPPEAAASAAASFPYGSLAQQQAAAFRSGVGGGVPGVTAPSGFASSLHTHSGYPYYMARRNQTSLTPQMTSPHTGWNPFVRSGLPSDLSLLQRASMRPTGFSPHHLLGQPSASTLAALREEQLVRELLWQRQQRRLPQGLPASMFGNTGLYAAATAQQGLSQVMGSHRAPASFIPHRRQEQHLSQLLGPPSRVIGDSSNDASESPRDRQRGAGQHHQQPRPNQPDDDPHEKSPVKRPARK